MSFILDALKKSEAERQRQAGPALLEVRVVRPQRRFPAWLLVVGGLLILVNLLAVLWLMLRPASSGNTVAATARPPAAVASPVAPTAAATAPAPASAISQPPAAAAPPASAEGTYVVAGSIPAAEPDGNPADLEPATGNEAGASRTQGLPHYAEVSNELPPLRLDLHVYAATPAERYAFINMHKVREGDTTTDGMQVLQITRDGVVLRYRNTEFLLGRE